MRCGVASPSSVGGGAGQSVRVLLRRSGDEGTASLTASASSTESQGSDTDAAEAGDADASTTPSDGVVKHDFPLTFRRARRARRVVLPVAQPDVVVFLFAVAGWRSSLAMQKQFK